MQKDKADSASQLCCCLQRPKFRTGFACIHSFVRHMSEDGFKVWAAQAVADRDAVIEQITLEIDAILKAQIIEQFERN